MFENWREIFPHLFKKNKMSLSDQQTQFAPKRSHIKRIIIIVLVVFALFSIAAGGVLIGVGIPAWKSAIKSGNETTAVQSIQTFRIFQAQYASKNKGRFAPNFDELVTSLGLDEKFRGQNPIVSGYAFTMKVEEASATKPSFYSINADPQISEGGSATGTKHFYIDALQFMVKYTEENRPAKADDPSI